MIDIYCNDGKCPICDRIIDFEPYASMGLCPNGCYSFMYGPAVHGFAVFGRENFYNVPLSLKDHGDRLLWRLPVDKWEEVIEKIKYYKENDHYLAEILLREVSE